MEFEILKEDKIKLWEKNSQNIKKSIIFKYLNKINLNYKIQIYYESVKASNFLKDCSKIEKLIKLKELKNSNNYFENFKSFSIIENIKNIKSKYNKNLISNIHIKIPKSSFFCLNLKNNLNLKIILNKNIFFQNESILNIIINYNKLNLKYYKYWDILIFSRFNNKKLNIFKDNILYWDSINLRENKINNNINEIIKKVDLNDINNKVESFETSSESYYYYLSFFLSKSSYNYDKLIEEKELSYFKNKIYINNFNSLKKVNFYKKLEIITKSQKNIIILPYADL